MIAIRLFRFCCTDHRPVFCPPRSITLKLRLLPLTSPLHTIPPAAAADEHVQARCEQLQDCESHSDSQRHHESDEPLVALHVREREVGLGRVAEARRPVAHGQTGRRALERGAHARGLRGCQLERLVRRTAETHRAELRQRRRRAGDTGGSAANGVAERRTTRQPGVSSGASLHPCLPAPAPCFLHHSQCVLTV